MARKPRARTTSARAKAAASSSASPKDKIIDALMTLLASQEFGSIGLAEIAEEAGMSLGALREAYDGKLAILGDFTRRIDRVVLDGGEAEGETVRDRLFELLMRRFDALAPYRDAVHNLMRTARRDLCLAGFLHRNAVRSQKWIFAAADADKKGVAAAVAVEGLVLVNAEALRVWLDDDDEGQAKTMAALDRGLARGERAFRFLDNVCDRLKPFTRRDRATRSGATAAG
jgi:AcrR family transcriptional regulator